MADPPRNWRSRARDEVYAELDHPADVFLEIRGGDLPQLFENALFALYDQVVELRGFGSGHERTVVATGPTVAEALRSLLAEALYRFDTEGYVATAAAVTVATRQEGEVEAKARLSGEILDRKRHTLLTEVKAVTYHRLAVWEVPAGGWRATVLFDV